MTETATITTILGGNTRISLVIEDQGGSVVKTIVPLTDRPAGTYEDIWMGNDENGSVVAEGDYYAILLYEQEGDTKRLDLGMTTGGREYNPPRTAIPPSFSPLAGEPLVIDFTLEEASQVTAFVGQYDVDIRWVTFMQRRPLGKGTHRITWNGSNSDGQIVHPPDNDQFLFGIFGYYLPDNAIYVRSGAHVSGLTIVPSIYNPSGNQAGGSPNQSSISFELSNPAQVTLTVADAESGTVVSRQKFPGLAAGSNTVTWDGKTDENAFVAPGRYRLGVSATDGNGFRSMTLYILQRVYY